MTTNKNNEEREVDFDIVIEKASLYWVGKDDNPLNGKTFRQIYDEAKKYGIENIKASYDSDDENNAVEGK